MLFLAALVVCTTAITLNLEDTNTIVFGEGVFAREGSPQKDLKCIGHACDGYMVDKVACYKKNSTQLDWECRNLRGLPSICNHSVICDDLSLNGATRTCYVEFTHCYSYRTEVVTLSALHFAVLAIPGAIAWKVFSFLVDSGGSTYRGKKHSDFTGNLLFVLLVVLFALVFVI